MNRRGETQNKWRFSLLTSGQAGPERNGGDGESSDQQRPVGTHSKQQLGGVVTISIFLITRWAPIQSNNLEGSSPSQCSSSPGGHPFKATTWRGAHLVMRKIEMVTTPPS